MLRERQGDLPAAQEERRHDRPDDVEVPPLRHEEEEVAKPRVLGGEAHHELRLRLGQVERRPVPLRQRRDEEDEEGQERERVVEDVPRPRRPALVADDVLHAERAGEHDDGKDREPGGDLVAHDLRRRADAAEQRPLVVGRPARHQDADHDQRRHRRDVEDADVQVGDDERAAEGERDEGAHEARHHDVGRQLEERRVRRVGHDVLLQQALDAVGEPLEEAGRPGAVRPDAALDAARHAPLDPGGDAGDGEHEAEDDDAAEGEHRAQVVDPARVGDQAVDEFLHQRSISGATRSRLAITAIRSAIMRLRLTFGTMLMAANEPVRILQR